MVAMVRKVSGRQYVLFLLISWGDPTPCIVTDKWWFCHLPLWYCEGMGFYNWGKVHNHHSGLWIILVISSYTYN